MTLRGVARALTNGVLSRFGLELTRCAEKDAFTMSGALGRAGAHAPEIASVIDLGASDGKWSLQAMRHFPRARYLLFEPLEERRAALDQLKSQHPRLDYALAAAGETEGRVELEVAPDLDGSGVYAPAGGSGRPVPVTTVDVEVRRRGLPPPYLLKFDTHGFELPILLGSRETLAETRLIVMEAYNFKLSAGCLRFHEMCAHLETLGFRCYDLADPMLRPSDGALWQADLFFMRATADLFRRTTYR